MTDSDVLFELTSPQELIWINEHLFPGTSLHTIVAAAFLSGPLHEAHLEAAVLAFVANNSALRTRIRIVDDAPRQRFVTTSPVAVDRHDLSGALDPDAAFRRWVEAVVAAPMPLIERPLYEVALVRLGRDRAALVLKVHHIVADGYSLFLFLEGVLRHYAQLLETGTIARPLRSSYEAFVEADRAYRNSAHYTEHHAYWSTTLGALHTPARLAADLTAVPTTAARKTYRFGADATRRLAATSEELRTSPFRVVTAALASVLARMSGNPEVCIGTPILNRRTTRERTTFGMFVNTLPLPFVIDPKTGLGTLIETADRLTKAAIISPRFPSRNVSLGDGRNALGLFDVGLSYQNASFHRTYGDLDVALEWFFSHHEMNAATVHFHDRHLQGELTFDIDYRTAVVGERLVDGLVASLEKAIGDAAIGMSRERSLGTLPLAGEARTIGTSLDDRSVTLAPTRLRTILAAHATSRALAWDGGAWTYAELATEIDARVAALRAVGVRPGDRVAIWAHRTPETVAMLLATWAAGAAYVPLDVHTPAARVETILAEASAQVLVTDHDAAAVSASGIRVIGLQHRLAAASDVVWEPVQPNDLCYVIFTSGSTGRPKGVAIDHGGLAHYLAFAVDRYAKGLPTSCPLFTSLGFDLTVTSLFLPLMTGGCLKIYREDADHDGVLLARLLEDDRSDVIKLTPAHLALLARLGAPSGSTPRTRTYVVGGEALPTATAAAIVALHGGRAEVINEYGPTEAVVGCTIHAYHSGDVGIDVPIGLPIPGTTLRVVSPWGIDQLPGAEGELLIGGPALAVGYLGRADVTAERFVHDPLTGARWYRTGDLVRQRDDGELDYLGRIDRQVKLRGFRIELGEIEAAYQSETGDPVCVAVDLKGARDDDRVLVLFYVASTTHDARAVRMALGRRLPDYMVPSALFRLDAVPLNANGKVDRAALQRRYDEERVRSQGGAESGPNAGAAADLSPGAARAFALIEPLLGRLDLRRSFVEAGGNSISAIQAVSRLQAAGFGASVRSLLRSESLADFLTELGALAVKPVHAPVSGPLTQPLPAQRWFLAEGFTRAEHWHQSVLLRPRAPLDARRLAQALHAVVRVHDALRLNVADDGKSLLLNPVHLDVAPVVTVRAVAGTAGIAHAAREVKQSFDLRRDLLLKATLLDCGDGNVLLLLVGHHLVVDVVSWHVLLADLAAAYATLEGGGTPALAPEGTSFVEWCAAVAGLRDSLDPSELGIVRETIAKARALPALPTCPVDTGAAVRTLNIELGGDARALLGDANRAFSTQPHELVLAAALRAVAAHFDRDAVSIEYESHGRHELTPEHDLTRTVGWLTAMTLLVFAAPSVRPEHLVIDVKDRLRRLPRNGLAYGAARERSNGVALHPMLRFNYLGLATAADDAGPFELARETTGPDVAPENHATAAVEMIVQATDAGLLVTLHLDARHFDAESAARFAARLAEEARAVAHLCLAQEETRLTPSDFAATDLTLDELDSLFTA